MCDAVGTTNRTPAPLAMPTPVWLSNSLALLEQLGTISLRIRLNDDERWELTDAAGPVESILGVSEKELLGPAPTWLDRVHPDDRAGMRDRLLELDEPEDTLICRLRSGDGSWRWYRHQLREVDDQTWEMLVTDLADAVGQPDRLGDIRLQFEKLAEHLDEVVWITKPGREGRKLLFVNETYERIWGRPTDELYENPASFLEGIHPDDRKRVREARESLVEEDFEESYRVIHAETGETRWVQARAVFPDDDLDDPRAYGIASDITRAKRAELQAEQLAEDLEGAVAERTRELRRVKRRYEAAFEASVDPLVLFDGAGRIVEVSSGIEGILGLEADTVRGLHFSNFIPADQFDQVQDGFQRGLGGERIRTQLPVVHTDGSTIPVEIAGSSLDIGGETHVMAVLRDLRERVQLRTKLERVEQRLADAERMELIGRVAGGVAHDLNNMLSVIISSAQLLEHSSEDEDVLENAREVTLAGKTAAKLSRRLLHLGRNSSGSGRVHLENALENLQPFVKQLLRNEITFVVDIQPGLPLVELGSHQVEQIILNLVLNARDAIEEDEGQIELRARASSLPTHAVVLEVIDTGVGMEPDVAERVFEPLYTTKGQAGTGLGLATVARILDEADGSCDVQSTPGEGTRFIVRLPARTPERGLADSSTEPLEVTTGLDVLVVDSDGPERKFLSKILASEDFEVTTASSATEVLDELERARDFDVVIANVELPGESGVALARDIHQQTRDKPVILIAGDPSFQRPSESAAVLYKPFTPTEVLDAIDHAYRLR